MSLNHIQVEKVLHQKYFGILPYETLIFKQNFDSAFLKMNKGISIQ